MTITSKNIKLNFFLQHNYINMMLKKKAKNLKIKIEMSGLCIAQKHITYIYVFKNALYMLSSISILKNNHLSYDSCCLYKLNKTTIGHLLYGK